MLIVVRFTGPLRALAGCPELALSLPDGATLFDLLAALRQALPVPFVDQVVTPLETGAGPLALLLVNRAPVDSQVGLARSLTNGDVVAFVPPMAGG
ncbi:MAG: MoaD/ThiS family protein [Chloroflexi bacterium]|nr:MoaD/ThiS family protein [Chloroflexota bacterium]MBU1746514.1 MoaD/ThiS family protein [Chloroflexota bacterium]MBU1877608.1 MoaD/ThiS family protein [Chloroflexota bacterium]